MSDALVEQQLDQHIISDDNNNNIEVNKLAKPVVERKVLATKISYRKMVQCQKRLWFYH